MENSRRDFIKKAGIGTIGFAISESVMGSPLFRNQLGANDKIRVGLIGFSNRAKDTLIPAFMACADELNFEIVAVSDLWSRRRDEAVAYFEKNYQKKIITTRNNEELYAKNIVDAVIISTPDFAHALHTVEAIKAGCDAYVEKPFAETMQDARQVLAASENSGRIIQIGSQRRSGNNYIAANEFIKSGKFGKITMVEMSWNVNQPGRWRLPKLIQEIQKEDVDWNRFLLNRPRVEWDPRIYCEYRLFWPFSSGIPGQWMAHQIDTVHWFTGLSYPKSVVANGGIYMWNDGRKNADTMTAVFEYGKMNDPSQDFQVVYSSRMHNSAGGVKELYYSNGGMLNLDNNKITPEGGLTNNYADAMGMQPFLLEEFELPSRGMKTATAANMSADPMSAAHVRNWMECVRSRKTPNAPIEVGYNHSIANIMTTAALHTGLKVTFDEKNHEVMAGDMVFKL
ncbi:MAG: Gfo/Idh/MocA family protein [Bacteroidales bacterium]